MNMENTGHKSLKVLITGASGLVGRALVKNLSQQGHSVVLLVRKQSTALKNENPRIESWQWENPELSSPPVAAFQGVDVAINLMGRPIFDRHWSKNEMIKLRESRVKSTQNLVSTLQTVDTLKTFISASAIGIYQHQQQGRCLESSALGDDFLAVLCQDWEEEARKLNCRNVQLRLGIILARHGGALERMISGSQWGFLGILGDGKQMMSWIHLDDVISAINFIMKDNTINGAVNVTTPYPITHLELAKHLTREMNVHTRFNIPRFLLKMILGKRAGALLQGQNVYPQKLIDMKFPFQYPQIEGALKEVFAKENNVVS